ncbi:Ninja-family protein AFP3 [Acorus gramineus]|uniref:Ninja-family protein n=1 Tax=Acorus gramineus TaxID=55184 RepID=A0AAV9BC09_ACOGR|nr:Ninja-family protein AFP3 [Acorus gramineus]
MPEATDGLSRDLLRLFSAENHRPPHPSAKITAVDDSDGLELSLGLSLGGRFGSDPKRLVRSSSVADAAEEAPPAVETEAPLLRACSLPAEAEEEVRKRKEMQSLRRMEAKRKRSEKSQKVKVEEGLSGRAEFAVGPNWAAAAAAAVVSRQGSIGSQGSSSSGASDVDGRAFQGFDISGRNGYQNPKSPMKVQDQVATGKSINAANKPPNDPSKKSPTNNNNNNNKRTTEMGMNFMDDMPCVFTKGDGPNGRKIEGVLYRYKKGEEVRIVCVCHGSFYSPAEFVKHAGGGDVAHPLKHIVVNPTPSP